MGASSDSKKAAKPSFDTLSIPDFAGSQPVTIQYQRRTQLQYACLTAIGLTAFFNSTSARIRVAGLSCLFPGAGFLAVGGILGGLGFILSVLFIPLSIFAWFGAGGLAFVLANWIIPGLISTALATNSVWEPSGPIIILLVSAIVISMVVGGYRRQARAMKLRQSRNLLLTNEGAAWEARAEPRVSRTEKRELSLEDLRRFQYFIEISQQSMDDWTNYDRIDQFQTSALRYQIYGLQWTLALVQKYYMPSFQGYVKTGQENLIDKSTTEDVMGYWKWESMWGCPSCSSLDCANIGFEPPAFLSAPLPEYELMKLPFNRKFTLDWDPAKRDNIMVTGYILLCTALYEKMTGDKRYDQKGSLPFQITKRAAYPHNAESIFQSLMDNWNKCSYCLYPCEPNWIYSLCGNLVGMQGAVAYETVKHTGAIEPLLSGRYHQSFEKEFMNADGSVVTLRSAITGFPMIGLAGVLGDIGAAVTSAAVMPNLARRLWLVSREAHVRKGDDGRYKLDNLVGADNMDVGNYKSGAGYAYAIFAQCAAEFGETELAHGLLTELETFMHPIVPVPSGSGALMNKGLSLLGSMTTFKARTNKHGDWADLITCAPDEVVLGGPKLDQIPFPQVMVARCHPEGQTGISFVLRGPAQAQKFVIGFKDLDIDRSFSLVRISEGDRRELLVKGIRPNAQGVAKVSIDIGDREPLELQAEA